MPKTLAAWLAERDTNAAPTPPASSDVEDASSDGPVPAKKLKITVSNAGRIASRYSESLRKRGAASLGSRRAKLGRLPSLPLDILYEIFSHLHPEDLLRVARTNKAFRSALMHRCATSVWKAACHNVPYLPDCPPDMSEPAYAYLAFDPFCNACPTTGPMKHVPLHKVYWELRVRLCKTCSYNMLWSSERVEFTDEMLNCLPVTKRGGQTFCLRQDEKQLDENLRKLAPKSEEREEFLAELKRVKQEHEEHGAQCQNWAEEVLESRISEIENVKRDRQLAIEDKLVGLGYKDTLRRMPRYHSIDTTGTGMTLLQEHPLVKQSKPLTGRAWKNMELEMRLCMNGWQQWLKDRDREQLLNNRRIITIGFLREWRAKQTRAAELLPSPADFCAFEVVAHVVGRPDDAGDDDASTRIQLTSALADLPTLIERWREDKVLRPLLYALPYSCELWSPDGWPPWSDVSRVLMLAKTIFLCGAPRWLHGPVPGTDQPGYKLRDGYDGMWWPQYLHHGCNALSGGDPFTQRDPSRALEDDEFSIGVVRKQWSAEHLVFDTAASTLTEHAVRACNLDPKTATVEDMDKLNPRLVCLKCSYGSRADGERMMAVRTWRSSVQHGMVKHWGDSTVQFQQISSADTLLATAKETEEEVYQKKLGQKRPKEACWKCVHCADTPREPPRMTMPKMKKHMRLIHMKAQLVKDVDYYRALDAPPRQPLTVKLAAKPADHDTGKNSSNEIDKDVIRELRGTRQDDESDESDA